jgi:hypothetical protein
VLQAVEDVLSTVLDPVLGADAQAAADRPEQDLYLRFTGGSC